MKIVGAALVMSAALLAQSPSWQIPPNAAEEKSPLAQDASTVKKGAALYKSNCQNCHGATGLGDGPDADLKTARRKPANLTISRTSDGVMFYKIWNGRNKPKMPAFKTDLSRDDVWRVIHYVKTFRQ